MALGFLKKVGKAIAGGAIQLVPKAAGFVGDVAKKAAPFVGLVPGVGTAAGALIGAGGSLMSDAGHGRKLSLGSALKSGAAGGLSGLAGAKLLSGKGILGVPGVLGKAKGLLTGGGGNLPKKWDAASQQWVTPEGPVGMGAGKPGILSRIGQFISSDPERAAALGLAGANLISGASRAGQADQRLAQARASLMEPEREDLSALYADPGNPYAQPRRNRALEAARMSLARGY